MATTHFTGPIDSTNGFLGASYSTLAGIPSFPLTGSAAAVNETGATLTITAALHAGKVVTLNRAAGVTVTLPAASGTGNIYRFYVGTAVTSNNDIIKVANASDTMVGHVLSTLAAGGTTFGETAGGTDDTITMNGTTTGGLVGSWVECVDFATNVWFVRGLLAGSGALASALSATV